MAQLRRTLPPVTEGRAKPLAEWCEREIGEVKDAFGGNIEWENWRSNYQSGTSPSTPDESFVVTHNLGRIPSFWIANTTDGSNVYATTSDRAAWTTTAITLRCTASSVLVTLLVM